MKMSSSHGSRRKSSDGRHDDYSASKRRKHRDDVSHRSSRRDSASRREHDDSTHRPKSHSSKYSAEDRPDEDFSFTKYKYELSKVFSANPNLVQDVEDFWRFVHKYETVQKKLGKKNDTPNLGCPLNEIGVPADYRKFHCINLDINLNFGEMFARVPQSSELADCRLRQFRDVVVLYLDFKQKEKFNKLKKLRDNQANLPVARYKDEIIDAVKNERVVVIAGDTGCGKSTQVPQYLYSAGFGKIGMACAIKIIHKLSARSDKFFIFISRNHLQTTMYLFFTYENVVFFSSLHSTTADSVYLTC